MTSIKVYDPAMCCSTGICGAEVDQKLVNFAADLDWLKSVGIAVTRINLSQEPAEFATNESVKKILENEGVEGLPVIMLENTLHSSGRYPARDELAKMAGLDSVPKRADNPEKTQKSGCGCGDNAEEKTSSGCC